MDYFSICLFHPVFQNCFIIFLLSTYQRFSTGYLQQWKLSIMTFEEVFSNNVPG